MGVYIQSFLSSELRGGEWLALRSGCLTAEESPSYLLNVTLGGLQGFSERFGEDKKYFPCPVPGL